MITIMIMFIIEREQPLGGAKVLATWSQHTAGKAENIVSVAIINY